MANEGAKKISTLSSDYRELQGQKREIEWQMQDKMEELVREVVDQGWLHCLQVKWGNLHKTLTMSK